MGKSLKYLVPGLVVVALIAAGAFVYIQFGPGGTRTAGKSEVQAGSGKIWKIGIMLPKDEVFPEFGAFKKKMEDLGHQEGGDVEYFIKNADDDEVTLKKHANEFLADASLDVIVAFAQAYKGFEFVPGDSKRLNKRVVFSNVSNFERLGLSGLYSATINKGLNFTGVICGNVELVDRRMEILKKLAPDAKVIGVVFVPGKPDSARVKTLTEQAADAAGVTLLVIEETDSDVAFVRAKAEFTKATVDGVIYVVGIAPKQRKLLAAHLAEIGIPAVTWSHTNPVVPNHIAALANDPPDQARQAAAMIDKIMNGVDIDDIPIEFARNLEIHLNTAIAEKANIKFPQSLLLEATVINSSF